MINIFDIMAYRDNIRFDSSGMKKRWLYGERDFFSKDKFSEGRVVDSASFGHCRGIYSRASALVMKC